MDVVLTVLPWLAPPILGAVIGYVTNWVAIRMLFRPRTAKHIIGMQIPFTPGIIPKNRDELARRIGQAVARELLSANAVQAQLGNPQLIASLREWIASQRKALMEQPVTFSGDDAHRLLDDLIDEVMLQLLRSRLLDNAVHDLSQALTAEIGRRQLHEMVTADQIADLAYNNALPLLAGRELRSVVSSHCVRWLDAQFAANRPLGDYVPEDIRSAVSDSLQDNMPVITDAMMRTLRQPAVRDRLVEIGRTVVNDEISRQGFLIKAGIQLFGKDKEISDRMPQTIDRMLTHAETTIRSRNVQNQLATAAQEIVEYVMQQRVNDVLGNRKVSLYQTVDRVIDGVFDHLADTPKSAVREITDGLYSKHSGSTLAELAQRSTGLNQGQVADAVSQAALQYLRSETAPRQIAGLIRSGLKSNPPKSLQDFVTLSEDIECQIDNYMTGRLLTYLNDQVPVLTEILDIERLVTERIDSFDVVRVERLVLDVTARHLRWVNYFGAILGAGIGLIQVLLFVLT